MPRHLPSSSSSFPFPAASRLLLLAFLSLHLAQARLSNRPRDKLQLKPKPRTEEVSTGSEEYDGIPAEHEYDVDLSDQEGKRRGGGGKGVKYRSEEKHPDTGTQLSTFNWIRRFIMGEDLADRLDDLICAWDKVVGTDLDTVVLLLLGWLGFGGVVFIVSHFIYSTIGSTDDLTTITTPAPIPPYQGGGGLHPAQVSNQYSVPLNGLGTSSGSHLPRPVSPSPTHCPHTVGSDQETVDYVNKCWQFLYNESCVREDIQANWLEKLNEFSKRSALDERRAGRGDGLLVEFVELLPESQAPTFSNMTTDTLPDDNMTITSDISATISFLLRTSRPVRDSILTADYILHVDRLRGRFSMTVITGEALVIAKLEGWPDIKIRLSKVGGLPSQMDKEEQSLSEVVQEVGVQAVRGVQLDINTNAIRNFPVFVRKVFPDAKKTATLSNRNFSRGGSKPSSNSAATVPGIGSPPLFASRQLDVKIVKAVQLGGTLGRCLEPYVVLEVDEPSQRKQTRTGSGTQFCWDETFSIDITVHSSELLFEVWDQGQKIGKSDAFMGLGIVAVSELMVTASQRHVIPLQGRPYEEDQVTGLLTIEFLFKDGGVTFEEVESVPGVHRTFEAAVSQSYSGHSLINKKTVYSRKDGATVPDLLNGADVADMALRDIQINKSRGNQQPSKSTLVIHQVQKPHRSSSQSTQERPESSTSNTGDEGSGSIGTASITSKDSDIPAAYRRGRMKKRNLISSIKRKFKGTRSLSSGLAGPDQSQHGTRSANGDSGQSSLERVRSVSEHRPENISHPTSFLNLPAADDASSMSDVSNISSFSAASNKTFVTEESSLVLETLEEGRHHHYLIPIQAARRGRFKKKGTKLHIFMDHIFVARHIKLGSACQVCNILIPLRLGKQAYVCRDCGLTCHKPCHVRVDNHCLQTSLPNMELEFYSEDTTT